MKTISTRVEDDVSARIDNLARVEFTSPAAVIRKCIMCHLPEVERQILGEQFVGGVPGNGRAPVLAGVSGNGGGE